MSAGKVRREDLEAVGGRLFAEHTVVLVVPETGDAAWAAQRTWTLARAASRSGRRVALVDLSLREPALDRESGSPPSRGITDAFLHGVSLSSAAQAQRGGNLHYLSAGTARDKPDAVWANPRWDRLAAGFRSEGALLLAYVPPQAVTILALKPDGLVVLAPSGYDPSAEVSPGMRRLLDGGTPLLATVVDDPVTDGGGPGPGPGDREDAPRHARASIGLRARRDRGRPRVPWRWAAGAVAVIAAIAIVFALPSDGPPAGDAATEGDSLYYAIQVASFDDADRAIEFAEDVERTDLTGTVTPVRLGPQGIWHRVMVGLYPNPATADSALRTMWREGAVDDGHGTILRTPHALELGVRSSADSARAEARTLRRQGIAAYVVGSPGGDRILVGAFEAPEQAQVAESLLTAAGIRGTLSPRTGRRR